MSSNMTGGSRGGGKKNGGYRDKGPAYESDNKKTSAENELGGKMFQYKADKTDAGTNAAVMEAFVNLVGVKFGAAMRFETIHREQFKYELPDPKEIGGEQLIMDVVQAKVTEAKAVEAAKVAEETADQAELAFGRQAAAAAGESNQAAGAAALDTTFTMSDEDVRDLRAQAIRARMDAEVAASSRLGLEERRKLLAAEVTRGYVKKVADHKDNQAKCFSLALQYCTRAMQDKLQSVPDWERISITMDYVALLKEITMISNSDRELSHMNPYALHYHARNRFMLCKQREQETYAEFYTRFKQEVEVSEQHGVEHAPPQEVDRELRAIREFRDDAAHGRLPAEDKLALGRREVSQARATAREKYLVQHFLRSLWKGKAGRMLEELDNSLSSGLDRFPTTLADAFTMVVNRKDDPRNIPGGVVAAAAVQPGVAFAATSQQHKKKESTRREFTCYNCGEPGHIAANCPKPKKNSNKNKNTQLSLLTQLMQEAGLELQPRKAEERALLCFTQEPATAFVTAEKREAIEAARNSLLSTHILCDNQASVSIFNNVKLLHNLRRANKPVEIAGVGGTLTVDTVGDFYDFGEVYFHASCPANIVCFHDLARKFSVTYDSKREDAYVVTRPDGTVFKFSPLNKLYAYDVRESEKREKKCLTETVAVTTVAENKSLFSAREVADAEKARRLFIVACRPSWADFLSTLSRHSIAGCPVTARDAQNALKIYGQDLGVLKGRTVREVPERVRINEAPTPVELEHLKEHVVLAADIMFVDEIPFLIAISRAIQLITCVVLNDRSGGTLLAQLKRMVSAYTQRGFAVKTLITDGERGFSAIAHELREMGITHNPSAKNDHAAEAERAIRTIKERVRGYVNTLPYTKLPTAMKIQLVYHTVFWVNSFPKRSGVSDTMSPREIVKGVKIDFARDCALPFGAYVQLHEKHTPSNALKPRTTGAICVGPAGNAQGDMYFYSLSTRVVRTGSSWTELPVPDDVIAHLGAIADAEKSRHDGYVFRRGDHTELVDNDGDSDSNETSAVNETAEDDSDEAVHESDDDTVQQTTCNDHSDTAGEATAEASEERVGTLEHAVEQIDDDEETGGDVLHEGGENPRSALQDDDGSPKNARSTGVDGTGERTGRYDFRPRKPRNWNDIFACAMTTMSVSTALREDEAGALESMLKEMRQLHDKGVFHPVQYEELTYEQRRKILRTLMFVKRKRDGTLKARACVDGRKQRAFDLETDPSSPTVSLEALMMSLAIDAAEERDVATIDIEGAYLAVDIDEEVIVEVDDVLAALLIRIDRDKYKDFVHAGKKKIYLRLDKALYGCVQSARLFYEHLSKTLEDRGFAKNEYDPCVFNRQREGGEQCTATLHVDDVKVSCRDKEEVDRVVEELRDAYKNIKVRRGDQHEYLGMDITFDRVNKVAKVSMSGMIGEIIASFPEKLETSVVPAGEGLFKVTEDEEKLCKEDREYFHATVAKLLYLAKRARPDVLTATCFLATRVKEPTREDWVKLRRVCAYLKGSQELGIRLGTDNGGVSGLSAFIDASYAVHGDCRGHTGAMISLGAGAVYTKSSKQKLNSKSSSEAELIGISEAGGQVIWSRNFLRGQGYSLGAATIYQDNSSAITIMEKGKHTTQRTKHLDIRHFFLRDYAKRKEISFVHKRTGEMVADFFTKPLHGAIFKKFRAIIMNLEQD